MGSLVRFRGAQILGPCLPANKNGYRYSGTLRPFNRGSSRHSLFPFRICLDIDPTRELSGFSAPTHALHAEIRTKPPAATPEAASRHEAGPRSNYSNNSNPNPAFDGNELHAQTLAEETSSLPACAASG